MHFFTNSIYNLILLIHYLSVFNIFYLKVLRHIPVQYNQNQRELFGFLKNLYEYLLQMDSLFLPNLEDFILIKLLRCYNIFISKTLMIRQKVLYFSILFLSPLDILYSQLYKLDYTKFISIKRLIILKIKYL